MQSNTLTPENNLLLFLLLSFIGGFTDASSMINFEVFTGHLTGNSIFSAIYLVQWNMPAFAIAICSLISFFMGSILGSLLKIKCLSSYINSYMVLLISLLFLATVIINDYEVPYYKFIAISLVSIGMGIQNGFFNKSNGVSAHSTYVTGMTTSCINAFIKNAKNDPSKKILSMTIFAFILGAGAGAFISTHYHLMSYAAILALLILALFISLYQRRKLTHLLNY